MNLSSRRAHRAVPDTAGRRLGLGKRAALTVPVALLALTAVMAPGHADDAGSPPVGGDAPVSNEAETPAAEVPAPEEPPAAPEEPKPAPEEPEAAPEETEEEAEAEPEPEVEQAPVPQEIPADAVPAGIDADQGAEEITDGPGQETCKDDEGWIKVDGVDSLTKEITASDGKLIVAVCAKSSTNVVKIDLDPGVESYTFVSGTAPWDVFVNDKGVPQNISHVSYLEEEAPEFEEIDPPALEPIDECGPGNAAYPAIEPTDEYTVKVNDDGSVTLTAKGDFRFEGGELTHTYDAPVDSNEPCDEVEERILIACSYPANDDVVARAAADPLGIIVVVEEAIAKANGFLGVFPFTYTDGDAEVQILRALGAGEDPATIDAAALCGEVAGICEDGMAADAVDENGEPCTEDDPKGPGEVDGVAAVGLPNTGGPAGILVPLGALLVLAGAGLVMVRRPHSA